MCLFVGMVSKVGRKKGLGHWVKGGGFGKLGEERIREAWRREDWIEGRRECLGRLEKAGFGNLVEDRICLGSWETDWQAAVWLPFPSPSTVQIR